MTTRQVLTSLVAVLSLSLLAIRADAQLIWDGDASKGLGVFKLTGTGNCASPSTLTAVNDSQRGRVWRYNKPSNTNRCENHGIKVGGSNYSFQNNTTYYLGWWSKLTSTANNNANFQWKSYGCGSFRTKAKRHKNNDIAKFSS